MARRPRKRRRSSGAQRRVRRCEQQRRVIRSRSIPRYEDAATRLAGQGPLRAPLGEGGTRPALVTLPLPRRVGGGVWSRHQAQSLAQLLVNGTDRRDGTRREESLRPRSCAPCESRGAARRLAPGPWPASLVATLQWRVDSGSHSQTPAGVTRGGSARLERRDSAASKNGPGAAPIGVGADSSQAVTWLRCRTDALPAFELPQPTPHRQVTRGGPFFPRREVERRAASRHSGAHVQVPRSVRHEDALDGTRRGDPHPDSSRYFRCALGSPVGGGARSIADGGPSSSVRIGLRPSAHT